MQQFSQNLMHRRPSNMGGNGEVPTGRGKSQRVPICLGIERRWKSKKYVTAAVRPGEEDPPPSSSV